jgi:tetratricopeptide (TPR) repeat protein
MATFKHMLYPCILFLCLMLVACSSPEDKKEKHYLKALEYIEQEENKAAILELRNALQVDENYAAARYQLGLLYLKEKDLQNAQHHLIRAADLDHDNLDASLKAAELYLFTRQNGQARALVQRVLTKDPANSQGLVLLANLELIEGNFAEALNALNKTGDELDSSDKLLNIKARIHAAADENIEAEEAFRKAIAIGNDNFYNYTSLLAFFESRKEIDKAKDLLEIMTEKFPDNPQTHLFLAGYHRSIGDTSLVEQDLRNVIAAAPENPRFRLMLADHYSGRGMMEQAAEILAEAHNDLGENVDIQTALAKLYFEQQNYELSREILDDVLQKSSGHGEAKLLQGRFLLREKQEHEAIEILENLNEDYPKWAEPYFFLSLARLSIGQTDLAQFSVATAIEHNGKESKYHALMAHLLLLNGDFQQAKKHATIALRLSSSNLRAAITLGRAMMGAKEYAEAIKLFEKINSQGDNIEVLGYLATALLSSGDQAQGIALLEKMLELDPGNSKAALLLVQLQYRGNLSGAEHFIRNQIEKAETSSGLYLLLGRILEQQAQLDAALAAYNKAIELNPGNLNAYTASGKILVQLNKKDEAKEKYSAMIAQNPQWMQGYMGMAALSESEDKIEEAMQYYRQALEIQPTFAPAANNLAWLIASRPGGDSGEALRLALLAKQQLPDDPHISDTLGWVHYLRGSYTLAIPQFELALSEQPGNPTISYHLALALKGNMQNEKAAEILKETLEKHSSFAEREEAKALLAELAQE